MTFDRVPLTAALIEAFAGAYLSPLYDNAVPTPQFHRDGWALYCLADPFAGLCAPRGHAKSTSFTHDFVLATVCFREQDYIVIVSATEELAIGHLGDIAKELRENDDLRRDFGVKSLPSDNKTDIVVEFIDGHQVRIIARGSGQKMRGLKWRGKRPGLIVCDDLEEDDQVENAERRRKFRKWFYRALIPCLRKGGKIRIHGTILHEDALLARIMKSKSWRTLFFKAHAGFSDFTSILWPEMYDEVRLRAIRQGFIDDGDAPGYSQEYLNDPFDNSEAYIRKDDILSLDEVRRAAPKTIRIGCDWAVSTNRSSDRTSFTVMGRTVDQDLCVIDQLKDRWDVLEWIDVLFELEDRYSPEEFLAEGGVIWKAIEPMLYAEMRARDKWLNIRVLNPVKDKGVRGKNFQKHSRAGRIFADKEASWYDEWEEEVLRFTGRGEAIRDDQFDSTALAVRGFDTAGDVEEEDFLDEEELEIQAMNRVSLGGSGRSLTTGY